MIFLTDVENFKITEGINILYFYANWMPYNKKMIKMLCLIEEKYKNEIVAIDVETFKNQSKRFDVKSIPEIIVFNDFKEIGRVNGVLMSNPLKSFFVDIYKKINEVDNVRKKTK